MNDGAPFHRWRYGLARYEPVKPWIMAGYLTRQILLTPIDDDLENVHFVLVIYIHKAWSETLWLGLLQ